MEINKLYYINQGRIKGPYKKCDLLEEDDLEEFCLKKSNGERFISRRSDYLTEAELIGQKVYHKDDFVIIIKIEKEEVCVWGEEDVYWCRLDELSFKKPLTKEPERSKIEEMNADSFKNTLTQFAVSLTESINNLAEKIEKYNETKRAPVPSPVITLTSTPSGKEVSILRDLFKDCVKSYDFINLSLTATKPNKKILLLDHRRDLLKQPFEIGEGTQIDIMKKGDPRINHKNYDLVIS